MPDPFSFKYATAIQCQYPYPPNPIPPLPYRICTEQAAPCLWRLLESAIRRTKRGCSGGATPWLLATFVRIMLFPLCAPQGAITLGNIECVTHLHRLAKCIFIGIGVTGEGGGLLIYIQFLPGNCRTLFHLNMRQRSNFNIHTPQPNPAPPKPHIP